MYEATWWGWLVTVWEVLVYNSVMDLQQCWQVASFCTAPIRRLAMMCFLLHRTPLHVIISFESGGAKFEHGTSPGR